MLTLDTRTEFDRWLTEHHGFEDGRLLSLTPLPRREQSFLPSTVTFELAYQVEGNYKANSTRASRVFRLHASGIHEYHLSEGGSLSPEHWSEGIELLESGSPIAFRVDAPATLTLCCARVLVEELPRLVETVKPWISDHDVYVKVSSATMPSPAEWVKLFERYGQCVAWHVYRGEPGLVPEVPQSDYTGWFLQAPEALDEKHQGLFFFYCKPEGVDFVVHLQNHGASTLLWRAAMVILGQFPDAEVHCGNCEFHSSEWLAQWS